MRAPVESCRWRAAPRLAVFALIAACVAGCSADATRLTGNSLSNPYAPRGTPGSQDVSGLASPAPAATYGRIGSQTLPPPPAPGGVAGEAAYYAPPPARSDVTGSLSGAGWNREGGTAITVAPGETIASISRKYGVPAAAILQANHIVSPAALRAGQELVIPRYRHEGPSGPGTRTGMKLPAAPATRKAEVPASAGVHTVAPGETLTSIARSHGKSRGAIARANRIAPMANIRIGQRLVIPGAKPGSSRITAGVPAAPAAPKAGGRVAAATPGAGSKLAPAEPPASVHITTPTDPTAEPESGPANETSGKPSFRWPVHGRIITGFGAKANGPQNDGINLAVPEGTSVKAADDGVVAYAGNELKGYGNLVLLRHGNGFVTAYAHASELMVKRGDPVKRGQVIARTGQTGSVSAPQLHFEIRKGKVPVDPTQYLPPS